MEVTFGNPGADAMIERIMAFQTEGESVFWSEPLYHFYPQQSIGDFMRNSYAYCQQHEAEIRRHIRKAEG